MIRLPVGYVFCSFAEQTEVTHNLFLWNLKFNACAVMAAVIKHSN